MIRKTYSKPFFFKIEILGNQRETAYHNRAELRRKYFLFQLNKDIVSSMMMMVATSLQMKAVSQTIHVNTCIRELSNGS